MTARPALTVADLDRCLDDERWLGFGYLGARQNIREEGDSTEVVDAAVILAARAQGWTYEHLFTWANSKRGRWYGDIAFDGPATEDRLDSAARYLNLKGLR